MDAPLIKRSYDELAGRGFLVVRFNWDFYTRRGSPSAGLRNEIADLKAAVEFCRSQPGADGVFIVGKSIGSLAAVQVALDDESLAGVVLMTVALHPPGRPAQVHPPAAKLAHVRQPLLIVSGDDDPLCSLSALYRLFNQADRPPRIVIVPGDHTLQAGEPAATRQSEDLAVNAIGIWLSRWVPSADR
jgi:predicted alpha/beta-hydrolase family hydrolase